MALFYQNMAVILSTYTIPVSKAGHLSGLCGHDLPAFGWMGPSGGESESGYRSWQSLG